MRGTVALLVAAIVIQAVAAIATLWMAPLWVAVTVGAMAGWNIGSCVRGIRLIRAIRRARFGRAMRHNINGMIRRDVQ